MADARSAAIQELRSSLGKTQSTGNVSAIAFFGIPWRLPVATAAQSPDAAVQRNEERDAAGFCPRLSSAGCEAIITPLAGLFLSVLPKPAGAALITSQHRQESLTRAYVQAIAGHAGLLFSTDNFDYGMDMSLHAVTTRTDAKTGKRRYCTSGAVLHVQLKSTTTALVAANEIRYDLAVDAYDELRRETVATPRILVLHVQPRAEPRQLVQTTEALALAGCCYWASLRGCPEVSNTKTFRIRIPTTNVFSVDQLRRIMKHIVAKEPL